MKMMAKSQHPTSGTITYNGVDINSRDNVLEGFGIMIDPVFYPEMTVVENLNFYLRLHGKTDLFDNIEPTLKLVELWDARHRKPKGFSFGMKQRTALVIILVGNPDFLILDEPFVGLNPVGVKKLIDILKQWSSERQISMLISSHQLSELEALCERYLYIEAGQLADSFDSRGAQTVIVELSAEADLEDLKEYLSDEVILEGRHLTIPTHLEKEKLNGLLATLGNQVMVESMLVKENSLQDIFK